MILQVALGQQIWVVELKAEATAMADSGQPAAMCQGSPDSRARTQSTKSDPHPVGHVSRGVVSERMAGRF